MSTIVTFETDEAAEAAAAELGAPMDALDVCGTLEAVIGGAVFEIGLDDAGLWVLTSNLDQCNAIRTLFQVYPDSEFVRLMRNSQMVLKGRGISDRALDKN
jgi:hypothetical protein